MLPTITNRYGTAAQECGGCWCLLEGFWGQYTGGLQGPDPGTRSPRIAGKAQAEMVNR